MVEKITSPKKSILSNSQQTPLTCKAALAVMVIAQLATETLQTIYNFQCGDKNLKPADKARIHNKYPNFPDMNHEKGELFYLCVHFMPFGVMIPLEVQTDKYGVLEITDSFANLESSKKAQAGAAVDVFVQAQYEDFYSTPAPYLRKTLKKVFSIQNLIIELENGKIIAYHWETFPYFCQKIKDAYTEVDLKYFDYKLDKLKEAKESFCANPWCTVAANYTHCDLKIFYSFNGTDTNEHHLTSKAFSISNFEPYGKEVYKMWDSMNALQVDTKSLIKKYRDSDVGEECITNLAGDAGSSPCVSEVVKPAPPKTK